MTNQAPNASILKPGIGRPADLSWAMEVTGLLAQEAPKNSIIQIHKIPGIVYIPGAIVQSRSNRTFEDGTDLANRLIAMIGAMSTAGSLDQHAQSSLVVDLEETFSISYRKDPAPHVKAFSLFAKVEDVQLEGDDGFQIGKEKKAIDMVFGSKRKPRKSTKHHLALGSFEIPEKAHLGFVQKVRTQIANDVSLEPVGIVDTGYNEDGMPNRD